MKRSRDDLLFFAGVALWIAIMFATWPRALSFGDELGYVGRAKLLLEGHLSYVANSPGVWVPSARGLVGKYPLFQSLLLAALCAILPRAMFALGVGAAVILAGTTRSILKSWGKSPVWALLVLAHPTVVILSRTTMADMGQATATVAAWWALRRGRRFATVAWLAVLVALKPTGAVLALGVVAGEALSAVVGTLRGSHAPDAPRAGEAGSRRATWGRLAWGVAGGIAGLVLLVTCNLLSNGRVWFDYTHAGPGIPPFELRNLPVAAPAHARALLLLPPLLFLGALTFWRRRELGPLTVSAGFLAMMCAYYFVDVGPTFMETLVLAPRLILPVVAFLLVGYCALLHDLAARFGATRPAVGDGPAPLRAWLAVAVFALPLVVCGGVSLRHVRYQRAMSFVRDLASGVADAHGERTLGVTPNALKAGLLHDGPTTVFDPVTNRTAAVFCSEVSASHRDSGGARARCAFPGYHAVASREGFFALARDDAGDDAR